ncbi:uncharacterized protein BX663DRAFT_315573 [Cokeromyces recurvatus]|uniref:uncharacterized protein n=1 Tax=Cokeromyces recurvatus TaxID=90255 RepID=UPI002220A6DF|nr:uncharacterized protein BX663DRAFT_315573 [Cokeromyces recurvatus]KAI7905250.1 hypothetical protein BX663DRAFT_315573 [Cokeromyces recurvatus]
MLNPLAHEFTPISSFQPSEQPDMKKNKNLPTKKQKEQKVKKKSIATTNNIPVSPSSKADKAKSENPSSKKKKKNKDLQANQSKRKSTHTNQQRSSAASTQDPFAEECKFITIEAAIDPIHRIETIHGSNHTTSSSSSSSSNSNKYLLEHGYKRYIDWIDRSLKAFDTITLVGMGNAVVDVVSLISILQDRKIGTHDDVETFIGINNIISA